jgi:ribosomal-protein-alanine N-acetyltransferase
VPPESEAARRSGELHVERAQAADAPALAVLAAAALSDAWSEQGFADELANRAARAWLVRQPQQGPVGYLVAHHVLDEIQVVSLVVAEGFRRRGIGRALLEHALAHGGSARVVHLEVRSNDAGAQAFYAELGFAAVGRSPAFYTGGIDAIRMSRELSTET